MDKECLGFFTVVAEYLNKNYVKEEGLIWLTDLVTVHHPGGV